MRYYRSARFIIEEKFPSLNTFYSSPHWTYRQAQKKKYRKYFDSMIQAAGITQIQEYELSLVINNRMDIDNTIMLFKFFNDSLKASGVVQDDSPKYFKHFEVLASKEIDKGTAILSIFYR